MASHRLRLVGSLHHGGLAYHRLEQAGLTIVRHDPGASVYDVEGDPAAVQRVIDGWDLEGTIEVERDKSGDPACWSHLETENGY